MPGVEREKREQRALTRGSEAEGGALVERLERSEKPDFQVVHGLLSPCRAKR